MSAVTFTAPPNLRDARCCGSCRNWRSDHSADCCTKYPDTIRFEGGYREIYEGTHAAMVCDDWTDRASHPSPCGEEG